MKTGVLLQFFIVFCSALLGRRNMKDKNISVGSGGGRRIEKLRQRDAACYFWWGLIDDMS